MQQPEQQPAIAEAQIVSATPGRLRVRLGRSSRGPQSMRRLASHIEARAGVIGTESNHATGSVIVRYDHRALTTDDLISMLRDVGVIVRQVMTEIGEPIPGGTSRTATTITTAMDDLDRRLLRATGRALDLKVLFPLALGALGIRQIFSRGLGLTRVPGYVLLWYAFDAFYKFHRQAHAPSPSDHRAARARRASGRAVTGHDD